MNYPLLALASATAFIFVFAFDFIYHGILLKPLYVATADLWRPEAEMMGFMPVAIAAQFALALLSVVIFANFSRESGLRTGLRFGALLGLLLAMVQFGMYTYLPMPLDLAAAWFAGTFIEVLVIGALAGLIYKRV